MAGDGLLDVSVEKETSLMPATPPPRRPSGSYTAPNTPILATRASYIASGPAGVWASPAGNHTNYITVTSTSPGPPVNLDGAKDYISYSPASYRSNIESRISRSSSPVARSRSPPHTPIALRRISISSQESHAGPHSLSRASSRLCSTPGGHSLRHQTSREDISDAASLDDPRSVMTEEVLVAGQPSLANMMAILGTHKSLLPSPTASPSHTNSIRLAPPIWDVSGPSRLAPKPHLETAPVVSPATSPAFDDTHDPFASSPIIAPPQFDRFQVSFPTSRCGSPREDEDVESVTKLNEANSRSPVVKTELSLVKTPDEEALSELSIKAGVNSVTLSPRDSAKTGGPLEDTDATIGRLPEPKALPPASLAGRSVKSSLPRVLRPRLAINFAWDDMSVPSAITIASTEQGDPESLQKQPASVSDVAPCYPPDNAVSRRNRTTSLGWATGLACDTASGLALYGLSYVPRPLLPRALAQRRSASEHVAIDR
ncbi:hypothetical protein HD553DRAFT_154086 [Filobasidium floriforme]|uniref:uncharacterized protein n=1 Tax=Filobasidium floriforme TaxID=5210 RepID=UPI001E8DEFBD|nr:uncharacterized protein HD553DRAFT_154086 [Filobasidium floriforme]KAH8089058.1 hypothetical protein HD553DRAFT_154086 [Filobasidium floriforme]